MQDLYKQQSMMKLCQLQLPVEDKSEHSAENYLNGNMILCHCVQKEHRIQVEEEKPYPDIVQFYDCLMGVQDDIINFKFVFFKKDNVYTRRDYYPNMPSSRVAKY